MVVADRVLRPWERLVEAEVERGESGEGERECDEEESGVALRDLLLRSRRVLGTARRGGAVG